MKEPMFKLAVVSGPELVPSFKPYVSMTLGVRWPRRPPVAQWRKCRCGAWKLPYKERPGDVDATGELIVEKMAEFINGLMLKEDPKSHAGFPATGLDRSHYLSYLLDMEPCPDF